MQHTKNLPLNELSELVREVWRPLVPAIDYTLARILGYAARVNMFTPYRLAKELGLSYSTAYVKIKQAVERRLILSATDSKYGITVKGCIAGYIAGTIDDNTFLSCVYRTWGLAKFNEVSPEEVLSFLVLLGRIIALRGLDLAKATICFVEEAAAIVFRYVSSSFLSSIIVEGHADTVLKTTAEGLGLNPEILLNGIKLSLSALQGLIPPTVVTENHRVFMFVRGAHFIPIAVECKLKCRHFTRSFGVGCTRLYREVLTKLADLVSGSVTG
jgi:hypothetical protein